MNGYRIGAFIFAGLCVITALIIFYRKSVIPWMDERDWQRRSVNAKKLQLLREEMAARRRMAVRNGRTERNVPGDRNVAG